MVVVDSPVSGEPPWPVNAIVFEVPVDVANQVQDVEVED